MPNQIIILGVFSEAEAERCFLNTWTCIINTCRQWIENNVKGNWSYKFWKRDWDLWEKYTWEFFHDVGEPGESITQVRNRLNERKRSRNWTGINWQGESSTLSGTDAVAWAELGKITQPHEQMLPWKKDPHDRKSQVERFYETLSYKLGESFIKTARLSVGEYEWQEKCKEYGEAFIDPDEELSIPELTKRLITHLAVIKALSEQMGELSYLENLERQIAADLNPKTFKDLNRLQHKKQSRTDPAKPIKQYWTGWFQGDGDGASDYLKWLGTEGKQVEENGTICFSAQMRQWGKEFKDNAADYLPNHQSRLIYAGGDDFLGVLYSPDSQLPPHICLEWFTTFNSRIWDGINPPPPEDIQLPDACARSFPAEKPITLSIGFVWVSPKVPQRDVLQHCREAEQSAKRNGKARIAFRIVFSGGNHLEWICPWWILEEGLFEQYRDRNNAEGLFANWTHFYNDITVLESRHAFGAKADEQFEVAQALFQAYFGKDNNLLTEKNWWNIKNEPGNYKIERAGILGDQKSFEKKGVLDQSQITKALNNWVINLAKVGFHLCSDT